jgi:hypothetical protein
MCYRLLSAGHALQVLQTRRWKIGRLDELNDPADCFPVIQGLPEIEGQGMEDAIKRYLAPIYESIGMVCFCTDVTDPVVWSHYADQHRGIALGFNFDPEKGGLIPHHVSYENKRPVLAYSEIEAIKKSGGPDNVGWISKIATDGFTTKAPSWHYENEVRIFCHLGSSACVMDGRFYFESCGCPADVVLGLRCTVRPRDLIRSAGDWGRMMTVHRTRLNPTGYNLNIERIFGPGEGIE